MTVTDNQILTAIADLTAQKGYPPTFRELGDHIGLSSTSSVFNRCLGLADKGLVEPCGTKRARGIRLTSAGAACLGGRGLPASATAPRVQWVPVLRSSKALRQFLEAPGYRERMASSAALAGQDVQVIPVAELRSVAIAQRQAREKPSFVFDRRTARLEPKTGGRS